MGRGWLGNILLRLQSGQGYVKQCSGDLACHRCRTTRRCHIVTVHEQNCGCMGKTVDNHPVFITLRQPYRGLVSASTAQLLSQMLKHSGQQQGISGPYRSTKGNCKFRRAQPGPAPWAVEKLRCIPATFFWNQKSSHRCHPFMT